MLNGYPFHLRSYLIESFNFGFQEHFEGERGIFERSQFNSAIAQQDMVRDEPCKNINAAGTERPFHNPPFSDTFCSP